MSGDRLSVNADRVAPAGRSYKGPNRPPRSAPWARRSSRLLVTLTAAFAVPATAQQTLPPIHVTAPAHALPAGLESLPVSATRIERDTLADAQYQIDLGETLARVPGLVANDRQNHAQDLQLSLRGFGARASFGVRGLRLYTDGIPATMPDGQGQLSHFDLIGAERVTVLRGPFSALYGASSGGVIELTSRDPQRAFAEISGWAGPDDLQRYGFAGALARGHASVLATGSWLDTNGYRAHSAATRTGAQVRAAFGESRSGVLLANTLSLEAQDPLGLTRAQFETDPGQAHPNARLYDTRKTVTQSQAGFAWAPTAAGGTLRVIGWAGARDTRQYLSIPDTVQGTPASNPTHPGGVIDLDRAYYGADVRWLRGFGRFGVAFGVDLEFLDERRQGFSNYTGVPGPTSIKGVEGEPRRDEDNTAQNWDPYAQIDWAFADEWRALLGVRAAHVRMASDDRFVIAGNGDDSGVAEFDALLPVTGVRWARDALALHASVSAGAETPTLNELAYRSDGSAGLNDSLRAARSSNVELGGRWVSEAWRTEFALFHIDTRDEIVVAGSSGGRTTFRNASGTRRDGVEANAEWQFLPRWSALMAYTLIDARYDDDFAAGQPLPGVPRETVFGELAWRGAGPLRAAVEALHRSAVSVDDVNTDAAPSYTVVNLRLAAHLPRGLELLLRTENLFDARYAGAVIVNELNGRHFEPAPGRGFGAGLRWHWDR